MMNGIPSDVLGFIFTFLAAEDVHSFVLTSKEFYLLRQQVLYAFKRLYAPPAPLLPDGAYIGDVVVDAWTGTPSQSPLRLMSMDCWMSLQTSTGIWYAQFTEPAWAEFDKTYYLNEAFSYDGRTLIIGKNIEPQDSRPRAYGLYMVVFLQDSRGYIQRMVRIEDVKIQQVMEETGKSNKEALIALRWSCGDVDDAISFIDR
jgi:hypothetical protein